MQLKLPSGPFSCFISWYEVVRGVAHGNVNWISFALGISTIVIIWSVQWLNKKLGLGPSGAPSASSSNSGDRERRCKFPLPEVLIPVVVTSILTYSLHLYSSPHHISIVGDLPTGFPPPLNPFAHESLCFSNSDCDIGKITSAALLPSLTISLVSFVLTAAIIKLYAKKHHEHDTICLDQDLFALGMGSFLGSCLGNAFVPSGSLSRTALVDGVGGKTQAVGVVSAICVAGVIGFAAPLLRFIPYSVLAAIVIVAILKVAKQLKDGAELLRIGFVGRSTDVLQNTMTPAVPDATELSKREEEFKDRWRIKRVEALIWWVTFFMVLIVGLDVGLASGMALCLLILTLDLGLPRVLELGIGHVRVLKKPPTRASTPAGSPKSRAVSPTSPQKKPDSQEDVSLVVSDTQDLVVEDEDSPEEEPSRPQTPANQVTVSYYKVLRAPGWLTIDSVTEWSHIPRQCRPSNLKMPGSTPVEDVGGVERVEGALVYQFRAPRLFRSVRWIRRITLRLCRRLAGGPSEMDGPKLLILDIANLEMKDESALLDRLEDLRVRVADEFGIKLVFIIPLSMEVETNIDVENYTFPSISEAVSHYLK